MRNIKIWALVVGMVWMFVGCMQDNPVGSRSDGVDGSAKVNIQIGKIGQLHKVAAELVLSKLYICMSAPGESNVYDTADLTSNGGTSFMKTYTDLASLKTWTLSVVSKDAEGVIIHAGQQAFDVNPSETTPVNLNLNSKFSTLKVNFFPVRDSVTKLELLANDVVVNDSIFEKQALKGDTVRMSFNYLDTGSQHIKLNAYGTMWGEENILLYKADTTVQVISGVNATYNITLKWCGPTNPPVGQANMSVVLGPNGVTTFNAFIDPPYRFYKFVISAFSTQTNNNALLTELSFMDGSNHCIDGQGYTYTVLSNSPMAANGGIPVLFDGDPTVGASTNNYVGFWAVEPERGGTILPWTMVIDMGRAYMFTHIYMSSHEIFYYKEPSHITVYGSNDQVEWNQIADKIFTEIYDDTYVPLTY